MSRALYRDVVLADRPRAYWPLDDPTPIPTNVSFRQSGGNQRLQMPHSAPLALAGPVELVGRVKFDSFGGIFWSKDANSQRTWQVIINSGRVQWYWWNSGGTVLDMHHPTALADAGMVAGTWYWLRLRWSPDNGSSQKTLRLDYAPDQPSEPTTWTEIGTTMVSSGTTTLRAGTDPLALGDLNWNAGSNANHKYFELRDGFDGPAVARFDAGLVIPTSTTAPTSTAQLGGTWSLTSGGTWAYTPASINARDLSGHGHHSPYTAHTSRVERRSQHGVAHDLAGASYVTWASSARQSVVDFSRECWVRTTVSARFYLVAQYGAVSGEDFWRWYANDTFGVFMYNGAFIFNYDGFGGVSPQRQNTHDGRSHHFVFTRANGGRARVWVDGDLLVDQSGASSANTLLTSCPGSVGRQLVDNIDNFNGVVHDVAIYDYELSRDQVLRHYQAGRGLLRAGRAA